MSTPSPSMSKEQVRHDISAAGYQQLAEFRYRIREFLHFSEQAARANSIEPQQHQLLLAIKGLPTGTRPTVTSLANRMCLRHHSTVELINRMVERGAIVRRHSEHDRREVLIELTPLGEEILQKLSLLHWQELQTSGPALSKALRAIVDHSSLKGGDCN
ncbi:MAG: MarR family transcriptional regulator [Acidobacteriaceae bacterium]|nr:MarR family transcriptional regulator [Acidobacteriaceae bacterium]